MGEGVSLKDQSKYVNSDKTIDLTVENNTDHNEMEVAEPTSDRATPTYTVIPTLRSTNMMAGDSQIEKPETIRVFNLEHDKYYSKNIYVIVESLKSNLGRLHPMYVGHIFHKKLNIPNITNIERAGFNRIKVYVKNIKDANYLVKNEQLKSENLRAFIPNHLLIRKAIIRHVDIYFDEEYLFKNIVSPYSILEIKRIKRRVEVDGKISYVDTQSVVLSFEGNILPNTVKINSVLVEVEPFVQRVVQCFKCLRYGHVAKQCRSTNSICNYCGKTRDENHTCNSEDKFCLHCKSYGHPTISKDCPVFKNQLKIKQYMASSNVTFSEAKKRIESSYADTLITSNRFELLNNLTDSNFPPLVRQSPRRPSLSQPNHTTLSSSSGFNSPPRHIPLSQPSHFNFNQALDPNKQPTKKRKTLSPPVKTVQPPPMFPFISGPSQPLPPNPYKPNYEQDKSLIITTLYNLVQHIVTRVNSIEELKNISDCSLKEEISILLDKTFKNGSDLTEKY